MKSLAYHIYFRNLLWNYQAKYPVSKESKKLASTVFAKSNKYCLYERWDQLATFARAAFNQNELASVANIQIHM